MAAFRDELRRGCRFRLIRHVDPEGLGDLVQSLVDARVKLISATPKGTETAQRLCSGREWLAGALERLTPEEIDTVQSALGLLVAHRPSTGHV